MQASERRPAAPARDAGIVVVGASAGGVEALSALMAALPRSLSLPVLVVLHMAPGGTSVLPQILARAGRLPVHPARDGEALVAGHVYVAPPDHHLLVDDGHVRLTSGPRENGHRPAVDPTMRTAALTHGAAAIGVVLSGTRDDGTAGAQIIKRAGGRVVVQDPAEAMFEPMPRSVVDHVEVDAVLPVAEIAAWLAAAGDAEALMKEAPMTLTDPPEPPPVSEDAEGTRFTCPDCGGVLFEEQEGALTRYRCSVGHAYSPESLAVEQSRSVEAALWMAVRILEDRAVLLDRLAGRAREARSERTAARFSADAELMRVRAGTIREAVGFPGGDVRTAT